MIGLVIVSHSARLAEGVVELAHEMGGPDVTIAAAGGLALPGQPLGTDAALVMTAIQQVYSDDGVLVLMDLGSAILSAEMALDLLPPEQRAHVYLCEAPLVEGAVVAAVQARLGSSVEQVMAEAREGLTAKIAHLRGAVGTEPPREEDDLSALEADRSAIETQHFIVENPQGLHLRPAARLVQTVNQFDADVTLRDITTARGPVNARSINAVTTLGVRQGHTIEVTAAGPDRGVVLEAIRDLASANFGDSVSEPNQPPAIETNPSEQPGSATRHVLQGQIGSAGIGFGPAHHYEAAEASVTERPPESPEAEWDMLIGAIEKTRAAFDITAHLAEHKSSTTASDILAAHRLYLDDPALLDLARRAIFEDGWSAPAAWNRAVDHMVGEYEALDDPYLRARAIDVRDVGRQVLLDVPGVVSEAPPPLRDPCILIADDLLPAAIAALDRSMALGIALARGNPTSHSTILARSMGIPMVVGIGVDVLALVEGIPLILDGDSGQVIPDPDPELVRDYTERQAQHNIARVEAYAASAAPAITQTGKRVEVAANVSLVAEARTVVAMGAEGIGVLRTEFLFLDRQTAPDEDEQLTAYRHIAATLAGRPLIIRTLDVGGDKPLPYIDQGREANPYLGWRGIRLCLAQPELFRVQLRAIVRTAAQFPATKVMFPMIATLDEFRAAKRLLADVCAEIANQTGRPAAPIETGIMVEVPSVALLAERFAREVDFFSIGTNDLTQYTLAAERGNPRVTALSDALHPAVLRLIVHVVKAGHAHGKWVGVCGELAADPQAVPLLVSMGVDELSMNATAIPLVKQIVRGMDESTWAGKIPVLLALDSAQALRAALQA